ncbi:PREDICTED: general transcription factor 3C polypeptide 5 isoform X2 [Polistes canadensis]|uniref:general transcription factor 3C polypeptide 5 isoform X2 n=1 Tax=Polistes canadensis TaxID=91411 RepID=UPI000718DD31|nr:PREDICTED: general transcription factor 3C polypeptide 5 isoform X2 [Polistes canadensis]
MFCSVRSEEELLDNDDDKDLDFEIQNYVNEINNEDSDEFSDSNDKNKENDNQDEIEENNYGEEENEYIGPVLPDGHRFDRKFTCIKYPGNVVNPDKAIKTLGGIEAISTAVDTPNRRLELRFRPNDGYTKPACGDRHSKMAFLLRVRVKKHRIDKVQENAQKSKDNTNVEIMKNVMKNMSLSNNSSKSNVEQNDIQNEQQEDSKKDNIVTDLVKQIQNCNLSTMTDIESSSKESSNKISDILPDANKNFSEEKQNIKPTFDRNKYEDLSQDEQYELPKLKILGRIDTEFQFNNLCDFQYLTMTEKKDNPKALESIYDKIHPTGIPPYSWLKNDVPYFLPPAAFSRMDSVHQYVPKTETNSLSENVIGKNKKRRGGFVNFICFKTQGVPTKPPHGIETAMRVKFLQNMHLDKIRQMFEERPIWSKNAILYNTKFTTEQLKILLPSVAYYFITGPWRIMWIRLGYDPRKDITARKYQTLDYRLRAMRGLGSTIKCKRNYSEYTLPYKSAPAAKPKTSILTPNISMEPNETKETEMSENMYIYREGMVPPSRQMFYQYCDILVDEVQEMLAKLPDPLPGTRCHEKRGWLPSGFDSQCREIINRQIRNVLRKQLNIPEDHPTTLPRKRKWGPGCRINRINYKKKKTNANAEPSTSEARVKTLSESSEGKETVINNE